MLPLLLLPLQAARATQAAAPVAHPLNGTIAEWLWLVPLLPFLGFLINSAFSIMALCSEPRSTFGPVTIRRGFAAIALFATVAFVVLTLPDLLLLLQ